LVDARKTFDRAKQLAENGFGARAALDDARKNLDVAQTQVRTAALQVQSVALGGSDYVIAVSELAQAQANLDTVRSRLAYTTISAPRDGVLIARSVERGDVVAPGKALLVLAPEGETQLVLEIDERNLGKISLGQKAVASADAYPDQRFQAVISYINPGIDINPASVEVKLTVPNPPAYLRQDMTVSVDIEVGHQDNALVLPARSVRDPAGGSPWVMAVRHGRAFRQAVTVGLHGQGQVQITDGMPEGAMAVPVASGIRTGQRLRPVTQ
jgi:HlyD family secretion protein